MRKIVHRSTHRVVGYHASQKNGCLVPWESQIEQAGFQWFEVDPLVRAFTSQPRTFKWDDFRYTPDALVETYHEGSFFVEIKSDKIWDDDDALDRLHQVTERLERAGFDFRLMARSEIFREPRRTNIIRLMRLKKRRLDLDITKRLLGVLSAGEWALGNLALECCEGDGDAVLQLLAHGEICTDINQLITNDSIFKLNEWKDRFHGTLSS